MFIFRVLFCFSILLVISSVLSEDLVYDFGNGEETNELQSLEYEYNQGNPDDSLNQCSNFAPDKEKSASRIDLLIASIRESSVDILQDVGDLEDILADRSDTKSNKSSTTTAAPPSSTTLPSSTTSKYVLNDMTIPSKNTNTTKEKTKDVLEEGKAKLKIWEEQIKICKSILENAKLPSRIEDIKNSSIKPEDKKKYSSVSLKNKNGEEKAKDKLRRKRRRLLREGMENFRQVL